MPEDSQREKKVENRPMPTFGIALEMTNDCILSCDYCYIGKGGKRKLSWQVGTKAIDWLVQESQNHKYLALSFWGGEPLMEFELIRKLVPYAKRKTTYHGKQIDFGLVTNCVLINEEMIQFFRQYGMKLGTSIDGDPQSQDKHRHFPDGSGTSAIIEPKIRKILKYWPDTPVGMTITNNTIDRWLRNASYLVELGYIVFAMKPVIEWDWTEEQWECLQRELRKISDFYICCHRSDKPIFIKHIDTNLRAILNPTEQRLRYCGAGINRFLVRADGTLHPCHRFGGESYNEWQLGSIFSGIDQEKRKILFNLENLSKIKADCENCRALCICGSCIAVRWLCFHDIFKPHPNLCKLKNMYFVEAMRIHNILESEKNPWFMQKFYPKSQSDRNQAQGITCGE